jgi:RHS repeat-associated protein
VHPGSFTATYDYPGNGTTSLTSSTTSVCTVSGNTVTYVGDGTCTLTASATATTDYAASTGDSQSFTIGQTALQPATIYTYTVPTGGFDGVGNIVASQDSIMGNRTYQYDVLNRLLSGSASSCPDASQNACWSYDDFGNRTIESVQTGACSTAGTFASTMVFNAANQLSGVIAPGGSSQSPPSLLYDAAGDVTSDSSTGNQYVYDAEGRICAFETPSGLGGNIMMGYLYDADGSRVAKGTITTMTCDPATNGFAMTGNNTGTYVLGQGGQELTQLSGSGAWQRTNVFGGGKQLATYDSMGLHFQIEDALGTRRMQTNADGQPETDIQSLPYGDALVTANDQYAPATADDATPLHFTGKERDTESGNDYFGARYYASSMGRFMSPDWSAKIEPVPYAKLDNPQSLNLYAYVGNNPLTRRDLDGHIIALGCAAGTSASQCTQDKSTEESRLAANASKTDKNGMKESSLFKETTDKSGKTTMTLNKDAASKWSGGHSAGFNLLNAAIDNKGVINVQMVDHDDSGVISHNDSTHSITVGLGRTASPLDSGGPANPLSIIAGHEVLGHGLNFLLGERGWGSDLDHSPTINTENLLRDEQHLPEFHPTWLPDYNQ